MTAHVDTRDVLERAQDIVATAEFELEHPDELVERCECGATLLEHVIGGVFVCAGCKLPPSYWEGKAHPNANSGDGARGLSASWERGAPPETSAAQHLAARKDAGAPDAQSGSGSGVLGRAGYALRSLRLRVDWAVLMVPVLVATFWVLVGLSARSVL